MDSSRAKTEVAKRRQDVAERYLRGEYQTTIAHDLGVDPAQISRDLKALRNLWLGSAIRDFDAAKAEELAKIDAVEQEAWRAWTRSQEDKEITQQSQHDDPITYTDEQGEPQVKSKLTKRMSLRKEGQAGAPAFLEIVLKCIGKRCEILGLDAPKRFTINWDDLTPEQEEALARGVPPEKVMGKAMSA
jgi:hypothetical protein